MVASSSARTDRFGDRASISRESSLRYRFADGSAAPSTFCFITSKPGRPPHFRDLRLPCRRSEHTPDRTTRKRRGIAFHASDSFSTAIIRTTARPADLAQFTRAFSACVAGCENWPTFPHQLVHSISTRPLCRDGAPGRQSRISGTSTTSAHSRVQSPDHRWVPTDARG